LIALQYLVAWSTDATVLVLVQLALHISEAATAFLAGWLACRIHSPRETRVDEWDAYIEPESVHRSIDKCTWERCLKVSCCSPTALTMRRLQREIC
jgi:hypothetical protein